MYLEHYMGGVYVWPGEDTEPREDQEEKELTQQPESDTE